MQEAALPDGERPFAFLVSVVSAFQAWAFGRAGPTAAPLAKGSPALRASKPERRRRGDYLARGAALGTPTNHAPTLKGRDHPVNTRLQQVSAPSAFATSLASTVRTAMPCRSRRSRV